MILMKYFLILIMFFLVSCVETKQINGIRFDKIKNLILKSEKQVNLRLLVHMVLPLLKVHLKKI